MAPSKEERAHRPVFNSLLRATTTRCGTRTPGPQRDHRSPLHAGLARRHPEPVSGTWRLSTGQRSVTGILDLATAIRFRAGGREPSSEPPATKASASMPRRCVRRPVSGVPAPAMAKQSGMEGLPMRLWAALTRTRAGSTPNGEWASSFVRRFLISATAEPR
jgi:hypothetical protein